MTLPICVATKLLPLFDNAGEYVERLVVLGLDDFQIRVRHLESFAQSAEELELSRRIQVESRKRQFWFRCLSSSPMSWVGINSIPDPHQGNWLDQLTEKHRKQLQDSGDLEAATALRYPDLDPCESRESKWSGATSENWRYTNITLQDQIFERRMAYCKENERKILPVADDSNSIRDWVAERFMAGLGDPAYRRIKARDTKRVTIAKRIAKDLELRFVLNDQNWSFSEFSRMTIGPERIWQTFPNYVDFSLNLHGISPSSGRITDKPLVGIPFYCLLELGSNGHYTNYQHLAYWIVLVTSLYGMVSREIESACLSCLPEMGE